MDLFASQSEVVTILRCQYENLLRVSRQFESLKMSLLRGGVSQEDLDVLVNNADASISADEELVHKPYHQNQQSSNGVSPLTRELRSRHVSTSFQPNHRRNIFKAHKHDPYPSGDSIEEEDDDEQELEELEDQDPQTDEHEQQESPTVDWFDDDDEQRTVEMRNLPDRCTHLDITKSIRGGALVQIYLRFSERMARVTFVDAAAAREFLARGERIGVYIQNKKIDLSWSDREFSLRPYIKQSIAHNGASRNLIIRNTNANITPALIREHLDHIHNLIVINIKVDRMSRSIYVCTNSVHNAMFARSCMRSRATYKGMKIDFGADECAAPWCSESSSTLSATGPAYQASSTLSCVDRRREMQQRQISAGRSTSNRFDLLSLDSASGSDEGDESDDPDS